MAAAEVPACSCLHCTSFPWCRCACRKGSCRWVEESAATPAKATTRQGTRLHGLLIGDAGADVDGDLHNLVGELLCQVLNRGAALRMARRRVAPRLGVSKPCTRSRMVRCRPVGRERGRQPRGWSERPAQVCGARPPAAASTGVGSTMIRCSQSWLAPQTCGPAAVQVVNLPKCRCSALTSLQPIMTGPALLRSSSSAKYISRFSFIL